MDNYEIAEHFSLLAKLMDINRENSFKAKSYAIAAFNIEKLSVQLSEIPHEKIFELKGIGESTSKKIIEILDSGHLQILQEYVQKTPPGVMEMLNLKGIGPKKISSIWKDMEIESIGELLYACQENRLKLYKGFGEKTQQNIVDTIEFYLSNQGNLLYAQVEILEPQITTYLQKLFSPENVTITGSFLRQLEIIEELEYVVNCNNDEIKPKFISAHPPTLLEETTNSLLYKLLNGLKLRLHTGKEQFAINLFNTSGSIEFIEAFKNNFTSIDFSNLTNQDDREVFRKAGINYIPPCLREKQGIIELAKASSIPQLIQLNDIKGIVHCHSNWSDGSNTLEEMAVAAISQGFQYMAISDHSKSAFYAQGLSEERIMAQHALIDELNNKFSNFKIFKSIESDILYDGSLDYSDSVLSTFDLVIASVHSILKMTEEKSMQRLITAIENPFTTILGHLTGRLLLSRKGYPVDHKKIIDACAANNVVIELNAHPRRLDIDWRYIDYALNKNVLISINPDAHTIAGFADIKYGVLTAQKAMVTNLQNLSSKNLLEFEKYIVSNSS